MKVRLCWGVQIRLRDGIHLNATLYAAEDQGAPRPCVVTLTPYNADTYHEHGMYFATHGVPFVVVDVRGRGNSEGIFRPEIQEARDGYDVVEWLACEPYCDGQVAMWGGSYGGYCQWATAKEFPPHLKSIVPVAAPYLGVDVPMRSNIFVPYLIRWLTFISGRTLQARIFADEQFWSTAFRQWHESGRPFCELDSHVGNPSGVFQEWIAHPEPDAFWDAFNPTPEQYGKIDIPILTITGSYDDDQPGALEHYRQHMRNAGAGARARHHLVIGPWDHAGTRNPRAEFGGLRVGPASLIDMDALHLEWYAWTMQSGPHPAFLKNRVAYYVMGEERWRFTDSLDEITARYQSYFLDSNGEAGDVFSSGWLAQGPGHGTPDTYSFDPRNVTAAEVDAEGRLDGASLVDQTVMLALRGKSLVYHSAAFERDTEISGFFKFCAWIAIDCPDTDIYVSIYEICLDGTAIRLSADAIRARYREGLRTPSLIQTHLPLRYDFQRFTFVSREIKQGHRLRLLIAPMGRVTETTFAERNCNSGGVVAEESLEDARCVTVRLFHDIDHPTALNVPLGRDEFANGSDLRCGVCGDVTSYRIEHHCNSCQLLADPVV
jgi:putative CocE/NonD family hydrolase